MIRRWMAALALASTLLTGCPAQREEAANGGGGGQNGGQYRVIPDDPSAPSVSTPTELAVDQAHASVLWAHQALVRGDYETAQEQLAMSRDHFRHAALSASPSEVVPIQQLENLAVETEAQVAERRVEASRTAQALVDRSTALHQQLVQAPVGGGGGPNRFEIQPLEDFEKQSKELQKRERERVKDLREQRKELMEQQREQSKHLMEQERVRDHAQSRGDR